MTTFMKGLRILAGSVKLPQKCPRNTPLPAANKTALSHITSIPDAGNLL
jgi:hypothetical protein